MIDRQRLNFVHNDLKNLAGDRGGFILFIVGGEGAEEDIQIRFVGGDLKLLGLLASCSEYTRAQLLSRFGDRMKRLPAEPD